MFCFYVGMKSDVKHLVRRFSQVFQEFDLDIGSFIASLLNRISTPGRFLLRI